MVDLRACACGSGLRALRCCALDLATLPAADAGEPLAPLVERAQEARRQGDVAAAERLCLQILELAPGHCRTLGLLYELRKPTNPRAAEALLRRIVAFDPDNFPATNELTLLLLGKGDLAEAELHARNAVRIAPENPQSHYLMGMVLTEANRPQIGEYHYRRALELAGAARPDPARQPRLEPEEPGPMDEAAALYEEAIGRRARRAARRCSAGPVSRRPTAISTPRPNCSTGPRRWRRAIQHVLLARAVVHGRTRSYDAALAALDADRGADARAALGRQRACWKRAACSTRWAATTRPSPPSAKASACCASSAAKPISPITPQQLAEPAERLLHRGRLGDPAARRRPRRRRPADLHPRLPALRHDPGRADAVGASAHRRPATNCPSSTTSPT